MKRCIAAIILLVASHAWSQTDQLLLARTVYARELKKTTDAYAAQSEAWPAAYRERLAAIRSKAQQAGDLDSWQVIDEEMKRFAASKTLSADDLSSLPGLRSVQAGFEKRIGEMEVDRSRAILSLRDSYTTHLRKLQASLTKGGKIPEALAVKEEILRIAKSTEVSDAERALTEAAAGKKAVSEEAPAEPEPPPVEPALPDPATDDVAVKAWLALRELYIKASQEGDLEKRKAAGKDWGRVKQSCLSALAEARPGDTRTLTAAKKEFLNAKAIYRTQREKAGDDRAAVKAAGRVWGAAQGQFERAMGLPMPEPHKRRHKR